MPGEARDVVVGADGSWAVGTNQESGRYGIYRWDGGGWDSGAQLLGWWRVADRTLGNPLMLGGQVLTHLVVEHELVQPDTARIIRLAIQSLASPHRFSGDHLDGHIVRWDAAAAHHREAETSNGPDRAGRPGRSPRRTGRGGRNPAGLR
jgi:hypothetical protein